MYNSITQKCDEIASSNKITPRISTTSNGDNSYILQLDNAPLEVLQNINQIIQNITITTASGEVIIVPVKIIKVEGSTN